MLNVPTCRQRGGHTHVTHACAGIVPTCIAHNALLVGYAEAGDLESADDVLARMTAAQVSTSHPLTDSFIRVNAAV